jgi:hypothetical protein
MKKLIRYLIIIGILLPSLKAYSHHSTSCFQHDIAPVEVIVKTPEGRVVANAIIELFSPEGDLLWMTKTDIAGKATMWHTSTSRIGWIKAKLGKEENKLKNPLPAHKGMNTLTLDVPCQQFSNKDIVVLLDATHSMKAEFPTILSTVQALNIPIMLARDVGERFLVQPINDQTDIPAFALQAAGGGRDEEAIDTILLTALERYDWDEQAASRQLIYITDALPGFYNKNGKTMDKAIELATKQGIKISTMACEGINTAGENILHRIALLTGGSFTYAQDFPDVKQLLVTGIRGRMPLHEWLVLNKNSETSFNTCAIQDTPTQNIPDKSLKLQCFPNPTTNHTLIRLNESIEQLTVYSSDGRIHHQLLDIKDKQLEIAVADWPAGIYWLEVINEDGVASKGQLNVIK